MGYLGDRNITGPAAKLPLSRPKGLGYVNVGRLGLKETGKNDVY
jgi:hypothetical protein